MTSRRTGRTLRFALLAGLLVAAVICLVTGSFLTWLAIPTATGGVSTVSGVGAVSGDSQLAGQNLNDVLAGLGSFRPGWVTLAVGVAVFVIGLVVVLAHSRRRAALRLGGGVLAVPAVLGLWWVIVRMADPDPAALLGAGSAGSGPGPVVCAVGAVLALLAAGALIAGLLDDRHVDRPPHRGIQR